MTAADGPGPRRTRLVAVVLTVLGGLALVGGTSADWVRQEATRAVAGVAVPEVTTTAGATFAGGAVAAGLLALLGAVALAVTRGVARRVAALVVAAVGVVAAVVVALGALQAWSAPGAVTAAPGVALAGAAAVVAGAAGALRRPAARPALGARYTVEGDADDEWRLADADED